MVAKFISFYGAWLATRGVAGNTHWEDFHARRQGALSTRPGGLTQQYAFVRREAPAAR
jgi:hypothetical protein